MIVSSLLFWASLHSYFERARGGPGRLVPVEPELTWRQPDTPGPAMADAHFEVVNQGGRSVRVLSIASGCACTTPSIDPSVIAPGATGKITFQATPVPVGERIVVITLNTDSPSTPAVPLTLRLIGSRRPPFVLSAKGDLAGLRADDPDESREVRVLTVEEGPAGPSPRLESDLSFLAFDGPRIASEGPYTEPGTICRTYVYRLRIVSAPAEVPFLGTIKVVDPWDQSRPISLNVKGGREATDSSHAFDVDHLRKGPGRGLRSSGHVLRTSGWTFRGTAG